METRDNLNFIESQYTPKSVRLTIPLTSVMNLRRVAEALRGLATQLEYLSHYPCDKPSSTMFQVIKQVHQTSKQLLVIRGRGRPKHKI